MIFVQHDLQRITQRLTKLIRSSQNLSPLTRRLAEDMADDIEENFQTESGPDGSPWAALSPVTQRERAMKGYTGPIGQRTGRMAQVTRQHDRKSAAAGLTVDYVRTFHYGAPAGAYGRTSRGAPIPWGPVPARPVAGFGRRLIAQVRTTIIDWLRKGARP